MISYSKLCDNDQFAINRIKLKEYLLGGLIIPGLKVIHCPMAENVDQPLHLSGLSDDFLNPVIFPESV